MESSKNYNNPSNLDLQDLKSELDDTHKEKEYLPSPELRGVNLDYRIFDLISHPICIADVDGSIKYVNRHWLSTNRLKDIEALDRKLFDVIHSQEREKFFYIWQESVRQLKPFEVELRIVQANGNYGWFLVNGQPNLNSQAQITEWVVTCISIEKYKQSEQEFEQQSEFVEALLTNLSDGIVACDGNGNLTLFNRASMEFHGMEVKNIPAEQWSEYYDLYLPDGKTPIPTTEIPLFRALQGESVRDVEMKIVPKQGNPRTLLANGDPIINSAGEKVGAVVAMRDITAQKQALKELQARDSLLSSIYNGTEVSIFVIDVLDNGDFRYVGLNPAYARKRGFTEAQIKSKSPEEILPPDDALKVRQKYTNCLTSGETISYEENIVFNGKNTWWLTTLKPLQDVNSNRIHRIIGTSIDITNRKQAEAEIFELNTQLEARVQRRTQQLQESEEKFRATFEQVAVGFAHVDLNGKWLRVNQKLCEIVGYSSEEILNLTFQDITHPDDLETDLNYVNRLLAGEIEYYSMEKRYIRKDGSTVWVEITPSLMRDPSDGEAIYFIAVVEEIEERKHAKLQLQQKVEQLAETTAQLSKRNEELDQFAYIASHDLKAPLRAIANLSEWLEEDLDGNLPPENQHQLELLRGRVKRMEGLIDGLLEYSRIGRIEGIIEQVDVGKLLDEVIDLLAPPEDFTIEIKSPMPILTTQKLPLTQVFNNLISNAIKHHPRQDGHIVISVLDQGNFYEFSVADDGSGIAPQYHQKIFSIFQTLESRDRKESTGIGLAIVKKILEDSGGNIWINSQPRKGSTFYFHWSK
ncbi:MAG: PAS domain S-box protein [Cyanobacteria bacterium P01_D01_bin.50]